MSGSPDSAPEQPGPPDAAGRPDRSAPPDAGPGQSGPGRPSGLRNPAAAVRGLGAATLAMEALVLLLAIQPLRVLGGVHTGAALGASVGLAVLAVTLIALLRRSWAWYAAGALQLALLVAGLLHWSLAVIGVIFGLVWLYVLRVRRTILG